MGHNEKKAAALGMPWGTANGRLRKIILFHLLKKHSENICHVCGKEIVVVADLSIEHKKPWEGQSVDLFWDVDNIAFSHLTCNKPHRFYTREQGNKGRGSEYTEAPEGQSWCFSCKRFKLIEEFSHGSRRNGADTECKICKGERNALRDRRRVQSEVGVVVA